MIDRFGSKQLENAFLWITLVPIPAWILLLGFGQRRWMRTLGHPLILPLLPIPLWAYVFYQVVIVFGAPGVSGVGYFDARGFLSHPLIFLVLWAHLQVVNLFVGTVILREGLRSGTNVKLEVLLAWLMAPLALAVCAIRVGTKRTLFRW